MEVVFVTGATRGLGLAIAVRLAADGYKVVCIGRHLSADLEGYMAGASGRLVFAPFDFSETQKIHEFAVHLCETHGVPLGLVNNAAIGMDGVLGTQHEVDIEALIKVNLTAPIFFTKYVSRKMLSRRRGRIVNVSSIIASTGFSGLSVYGATKAGLVGFTKSLARELGKVGITVNAVAPGYMATAMTSGLGGEKLESIKRRSALGRLTAVDDVAGAVAYLIGKDGGAVTGTVITIDAGSTA
ncbi:MAG: SDR family NAD(P)-dependent oxidoreductase [Pseudomonadota bacterium]